MAAESYVPLAYTSSRSVKVDGEITSFINESVVFPRTLDGTITMETQSKEAYPYAEMTANPTRHNATHPTISDNTPTVTLYNGALKVRSALPSDITVCDVAGRVWRKASYVDGDTTIPLYGLPDGEYVVAVTTAGTVSTTTITLRP